MPLSRPIRVGIAGTGFISEFHANAIGAIQGIELVSVCDPNLRLAEPFAARQRISEVFNSLDSMLHSQNLDCVHILAPPDKHFSLAKTALQSGVHVFVEKPMCTSLEEADELLAIARDKGLYIGVNHNFLYSSAYRRLKEAINSGTIGTLDYASFNYFLELGQIRSGPFDSWMLREPGNVIFEVGPHPISALLDLVGRPNHLTVAADRGVNLPGGARVPRRWRIHATVSQVAVDININLSPCFHQRTMSIHGLWGSATADLDANTCLIDQTTPLNFDLDRYHRSRSLAKQLNVQARETLADFALSKFKLRSRGNPYQSSIIDSVADFYSSLREGRALDERIDGAFGRDVIVWCKKVVEATAIDRFSIPSRHRRSKPRGCPTVLVLGGSGFIGRELIQQLLAAGYCVRAMVRNSGGQLEELENESLEVVRGDMRNMADLESAMRGVKFVYHLAVSEAKTWDDSVRNIVEPTRLVAKACLSAGVERLIYTGTIDCYYAGARAGTISELTPLDKNIRRRNYYARAKALSENDLKEMHRINGLPLVIFRPGIVIGRGGSPFHFGVGRFSGRICEVWGQGNNKLPFVLASDVASVLVKGIEIPGIEGKSFNLVDMPMLTAREYLEELQNRMESRLVVRHRSIWQFYVADLSKWTIKLVLHHPDSVRIPSYFDWESRTQKAIFDCTLAREELGWRPASDRKRMIEEGIGEPLEAWLKAVR
jgi:predicted dehydrogenase/nucleoside-diphosphate-sugar epimerase